MDSKKFNELLEQAKSRRLGNTNAISNLQELVSKSDATIDLSSVGLPSKDEDNKLRQETAIEVISDLMSPSVVLPANKVLGVSRDDITLNEKQTEFKNAVVNGRDVVLIGAAGTGKTTSMRQTTAALIEDVERLPLLTISSKYLQSGVPGGAILSYTRKAVNNIRHAVVDALKPHTLTIHKLLEFEPVFYEIPDPNNINGFKTTMKFEPARTAINPLPSGLIFLAFEESSMIATDLYRMLQDAMPHAHQEVFLGDIQQLPPIFGPAILGFKMVELQVIELTEIYRQAANSPIISLAHKILSGNHKLFNPKRENFTAASGKTGSHTPALTAMNADNEHGYLKITTWDKKYSDFHATQILATQFNSWEARGYYKPFEDIILMPFNVNFGTIELNKSISQHMGLKRGAVVYEVISGFQKHYLAVGDRVLYDKEDAVITSIRTNPEYMGVRPAPASVNLDRWGMLQAALTIQERLQQATDEETFALDVDAFLDNSTPIEDRVNQASHVVTVQLTYQDGEENTDYPLQSAAEVNALLGGHAITVHKFQGSENDRVFFIMHQSYAVMNQRELLYTAITRAKKWLHIHCESDTFWKGIQSQKVKGNTIAEKAEIFKGKKEEADKLNAAEIVKHNSLSLVTPPVTTKPVTTIISGAKAIKLSDLPSPAMKAEAQESLDHYWEKAINEFGLTSVGKKPTLHFNIRSPKLVGRANWAVSTIAINPIWLAVAEKDEEVRATIVHDTMIHKICHIVAARKYRDFGHDVYWRNCMRKMGRTVNGKDNAVGLPPWFASRQALLTEVLLSVEEKATEEEQLDKNEVE